MDPLKQYAILGPTASGKTALALDLARQTGGNILSLDSLAVYRHIDIASAKPARTERGSVPHFGLDLIDPDMPFDVTEFIHSYHRAADDARARNVPLIIAGGSGFYLKMLIEGISPLPDISDTLQQEVQQMLEDLREAYSVLMRIDPALARTIEPTDRYRIEKALLIARATHAAPTDYFRAHPPVPVITTPLPLYEIVIARPLLRERIALRTAKMLRDGLIDEVCGLERRYTRAPHPMKAIGIREVLDYLDGIFTYEQMREAIITHTARLAKRQVTFNKTQFDTVFRGTAQEIRDAIWGSLK